MTRVPCPQNKEGSIVAEIKSTLDLVMEKTKDLTLSAHEKKEQQRKALTDALKGVLQKYEDGVFSPDHVEKEIESLEGRFSLDAKPLLKDLVFDRLTLDPDNPGLLELIRRVLSCDTEGISGVLSDYRRARDAVLDRALREALTTLREKHGISGSAVMPNPENDPNVKTALEKIRASFNALLEKEKARLCACLQT